MQPTKRLVRLIEKNFHHRFKIAKLTHVPVFRWIINKMLFDKNDITYLIKDSVVKVTLNKEIKQPDSIVVPSKVVEYFIDKSSYRFIMDFCLCREAMTCKDYPIELGCLFMGDAAKKISQELGRSVSKKEALYHVEKCRDAGLVHLIGRDKLDETWLGVGSKIPLVTVCNCCNCCCLWRMLPYLENSLSSTVKKMPGVKIKVNNNCTGCGVCSKDICFINAIKISKGVAVIGDSCLACGRCVEICPNNAIELIIEDNDFIKKTIERVRNAID
jgi:hypothetical protein